MTTLVRIGALSSFVLACVLLIGCGGSGNVAPTTTIPVGQGGAYSNDLIRVGDKITVQLSGVPDPGYYVEKQIPPSGEISLPYLSQPFHAVGITTEQLGEEVTDSYKAQKIYTSPVITVLAEERYITVGGEVRTPSSVPYRPDLTLIGAINSCAGFTEYANRRSVRIIRGKDVFYVDAQKAVNTPGDDPPIYPGDQIYVSRTAF